MQLVESCKFLEPRILERIAVLGVLSIQQAFLNFLSTMLSINYAQSWSYKIINLSKNSFSIFLNFFIDKEILILFFYCLGL